MTEFGMPKLGHLMEEGIIIGWNKKEGDRIEKGEVLLMVETDKATLDVESNISGIVRKILANQGDSVAVNAAIVIIDED
jgi:pyruvate/2-oxoglutarate dehydrogenase complex dihydrolipoamide acyltransferase (E2) component